ncbi:MAG: hypothetical protein HFACDABA_01164 [Anaerolineales bacterium]|nr:hypothetical protein [Anaerolineales bacterium]
MSSSRFGPLVRSFPFRIFLIALCLRLIPVLFTRSLGIGLDDMFQYDMLARSLAGGNGFRWYARADLTLLEPYVDFDLSDPAYDPVRGVATSFRAPLYPAFLALIYSLFGAGEARFFAARFAQALLGASLAPLAYWIALRFLPAAFLKEEAETKAARLAAWMVAAYPILLLYPIGLVTENLFLPFVLLAFLFLLRARERPAAARWLLSGAGLGLAALTRSVILPFAALAVLWAWFALRQKRGAALMALALALTVAPWVVRNSLLHQKLSGIESSMGYNLYLGYHPDGDGSFFFGPSLDLLPILDDAARDRIGTQKALGFIQERPDRILPLALNRLGFFFGLETRAFTYFYSNDVFGYVPPPFLLLIFLLLTLPFIVVSVSAACGSVLLRWNPPAVLLLLLFVSYVTPHVFILSEDRFHLALVPFMAISAAWFWTTGCAGLAARWRASRASKMIALLAAAAVCLLLFNWGLELWRDTDTLAQLFGPHGNQSYFSY